MLKLDAIAIAFKKEQQKAPIEKQEFYSELNYL
jgi:hypothetical protein